MADVLERPDTPAVSTASAKSKLKVIDCDIHPSLKTRADLYPFMARALAGPHGDLRRPPAHALHVDDALPAVRAAAVTP